MSIHSLAVIPGFGHQNEWLDEELEFLADALFEDKVCIQATPSPALSTGSKSIITSRLMVRENVIVSPPPSVASDSESISISESERSDESVKTDSESVGPFPPTCSMSKRVEATLVVSHTNYAVISPSPCGSNENVMVLPAPPRRLAFQSKHRDIFLKAVAVAAAEQKGAPKRSSVTVEDPKSRQRERNRIMAKQTRERKKTAMASLKIQFAQLQGENKMLKALVTEHTSETESRAILEGCTTLDNIPEMVWEACDASDSPQDQDEFNGVTGRKRRLGDSCDSDSDDCSHAGVSVFSREQESPKRQRFEEKNNAVAAVHSVRYTEPHPTACTSADMHQIVHDYTDDCEIIQDLVMSMDDGEHDGTDAIYQDIHEALAEEEAPTETTPPVPDIAYPDSLTKAADEKTSAVVCPEEMVIFSIPNPVAVLG